MTTSQPITRRRVLKSLFCASATLALGAPARVSLATTRSAVHLLSIGDFGTTGEFQVKIAKAMQEFVSENDLAIESLLLLGDNFYSKVKDGFSVSSSRWQTGFEEMYPSSVFPGPCHVILGNHDYHDNPGGEQVQLAYAKQSSTRYHLPSKWYRFEVGGAQPLATILALDTNFPKVSGGKWKDDKPTKACLSQAEVEAQLEWLHSELEKPRAPITIVMGHHPLYSNGAHGDSKELLDKLEPLFEKHQVHLYLCGHEHDLQHLEFEDQFTSYAISGGGGARVRELKGEHKAPFGDDVYGFSHLQFEPGQLTLTHHGIDGSPLHRFQKFADGTVKLVT